MIFPFLNGFQSFFRAPMTWILLVLNVGVFMLTIGEQQHLENDLYSIFSDEAFIATQAQVYKQYLFESKNTSRLSRSIAQAADQGSKKAMSYLSLLAFRDERFISEGEGPHRLGDPVAISHWEKKKEQYQKKQAELPSQNFGLTKSNHDWTRFILYQFFHGGFEHLLGNMMFLFIFGSAIELSIGGLGLLLLYLLSGIFGAFTFMSLSGFSESSLIGASGAISGIMSFWLFMNWKQKVRFFFWVLPIKSYFGFLYLPAWVIVIFYLSADWAGWIGQIPELGGVAYTAHIGGAALGFLLAFFFTRTKWRRGSILYSPSK